ncbi:hypothetical protein BDV59DRAFT_189443 [Aspergillus ambiguus]|uniref:uncharacterized protein n=1 Tax=Aspergillus ambiguus TaxID=176160 RepID=UPI003CCDE41D
MRPALLRLLKRPSALSVIDSLISVPVGIEQLESRYRSERIRCYSQSVQPATCVDSITLGSANKQLATRRTRPPPSFRVHGIQPPPKGKVDKDGQSSIEDRLSANPRALGLQPDKLEFESDIGHSDHIGTRLVDDQAHRHDFALWEELLRYRQRHYGERGSLDIWEGLMTRLDGIELPVTGERADLFWQSFVDLGLKRDVIMRELVSYAFALWDRTGKRWNGFYESVVVGFLERGMTQRAVEWHKKLQHPHLSHPNDILRILKAAVMLHHRPGRKTLAPAKHVVSPGLSAFQNICRATPGHRIYGPVITTLLKSDCIEEAIPMHLFMIEQGDHPSSFEEMRSLLEYAEQSGPSHVSRKLRRYANSRFPDSIDGDSRSEIQEQSSAQLKHADSWPPEKPFKDEFGARIFATKALNFDMILSGLRMFSVPAIGPHSLREMAIRAHGGHDILDKLQRLEKAGISIGDSVFSRLLRKLAVENRSILLSDFLHSDQHPDMLEDAQAQESLFVSYYIARDWRLYNMTAAILGELCKEEVDLVNIHFRKHVAAGEFALASKTVDDMVLRGMTLTSQSVDYMVSQVLAPRRLGAGPVHGSSMSPAQEIDFVFRILQRVVPAGTLVTPDLWVEMLKRLGMTGKWNDLHKCCHWLARHYTSHNGSDSLNPSKHVNHEINVVFQQHGRRLLQTIFSRRMQAAIVAWGFRKRVSSKPRDDLIPWVRGLTLLRALEKNGVHLWDNWIRRACRHRLAVLYGSPRQSSRLMNRMLRRENPYSLSRVMEDINRAWGEPLFGPQTPENVEELVNPPSSSMSQRRTQRTLFREAHFRRGAFVRTR